MPALTSYRFLRKACFSCLMLACGSSHACEIESPAVQELRAGSSTIPWREFQTARGKHTFFGLASYYNGVSLYVVGKDAIQPLEPGETFVLRKGTWLAAVARLDVLLVQSPGLSLRLGEWSSTLEHLKARVEPSHVQVVRKSDLHALAPEFDRLRYAHLWAPLSWLAKVIEYSLTAIQAHVVSHWGLAIVSLGVLLKLVLFPVQIAVTRMQDEVSRVRSLLEPQLAEIKANHDGEEAHRRVMAAHKALGVTPFYPLKPSMGLLIQVPVWIAVFNALGEMPQLAGQSFLWIEDLAYPDAIAVMPFSVPLFGATVHLLPFVMAGVACLAARTIPNDRWSKIERARQRRTLYWMAAAFLFLFYPFPAAMVLYWTMNNLLQIVALPAFRTSTRIEP